MGSRRDAGPRTLRQPRERQQRRHHSDGHVDPEDPVPVETLGHPTADQRATGDGESGNASPESQDHATPLGREGARQDGKGKRGHHGGSQTLHGPCSDQRLRCRRQRARGRGHAEQRQASGEHPAAAEAVSERGGGDDARRERECVGVDRPLQGGQVSAEVALNRRQSSDDDQRVQRHHERRQRRERQRPNAHRSPTVVRDCGGATTHDSVGHVRASAWVRCGWPISMNSPTSTPPPHAKPGHPFASATAASRLSADTNE